ncbi:hypothetical protein F4604DRAFT_84060 [Suillus subluteus]|nr:hypothetical protein F4604DRAFT_84060 [Suillus subluteus]
MLTKHLAGSFWRRRAVSKHLAACLALIVRALRLCPSHHEQARMQSRNYIGPSLVMFSRAVSDLHKAFNVDETKGQPGIGTPFQIIVDRLLSAVTFSAWQVQRCF